MIHKKSQNFYQKMSRNELHFQQYGSLQKYLAFVYNNNKQSEKVFRKIPSNRLKKYLGTNLTKENEELYKENIKSMEIEIEGENTDRWQNLLYSLIRKINVVKMTNLPKAHCRFSAIPITIQNTCFTELGKNLKFTWKHNNHNQTARAILSTKSNARGLPYQISNCITEL